MEININDIIKTLEMNKKVTNHIEQNNDGLIDYKCSTFINNNLLIKGEGFNKHDKKKNAMIVLIDPESGYIMGKSKLYEVHVTKRARRDILQS